MRIRYTWDIGIQTSQRKNLEPVSSTSRRGARAAYYDEYPRDFGPQIAYTVSLVSDTSRPPTLCRPPIRQGGREMSAPRPYETDPFHPPALFRHPTIPSIDIYMLEFWRYFFLMVSTLCLGAEYTRHLRMRSSRLPLTLSFRSILK
mgnify:CR=1 FL=1